MTLGRVAFTVLILGVTLGCLGDEPLVSSQQASRAVSEHNQAAVLKCFRPFLATAKKPGRLYYHTVCSPHDAILVLFPLTDVHPPPKGKEGVEAVRDMFPNYKDVLVTEGISGIVRISIGDVPTAILQTRISVLAFGPMERYNPLLAIGVIESTEEWKVAMKGFGFAWHPTLFDILVVPPTKGLPHLRPTLRNVTVEEALDTIAKTFQGIVLYGICTCPDGKGQIDIDFASVAGDDSETPSAVGRLQQER